MRVPHVLESYWLWILKGRGAPVLQNTTASIIVGNGLPTGISSLWFSLNQTRSLHRDSLAPSFTLQRPAADKFTCSQQSRRFTSVSFGLGGRPGSAVDMNSFIMLMRKKNRPKKKGGTDPRPCSMLLGHV